MQRFYPDDLHLQNVLEEELDGQPTIEVRFLYVLLFKTDGIKKNFDDSWLFTLSKPASTRFRKQKLSN